MRGRKPKPTVLKKLAGNPGRRPLPKNEPMPTGIAKRPSWLPLGAVRVWDELAPVTQGLGLLTEHDGEAFGMLCTLAAEFRFDAAAMSANRISRLDGLMQRFGMDPASRARISVKPSEGATDEERFFGT
jgi:phage terminase small subunit